jgi:hypothetical protein
MTKGGNGGNQFMPEKSPFTKLETYTAPRPAHQRAAVENLVRLATNGDELGNAQADGRKPFSRFNKMNGRHEETRTPDLYRVKVAL